MTRLQEIIVEYFKMSDETSKLIYWSIFSENKEEAMKFSKVIDGNMKKLDKLVEEIEVLMQDFIS